MTVTASGAATPRSDGTDSGAVDPDVVLIGEWPEEEAGTPVQVSDGVDNSVSKGGRAPDKSIGWGGRNRRSWRPSAVLALLVLTAAVLMLLDLRDGPTQVLRSVGQSTAGTAQAWADRVMGPIRETPLRRPDGPALKGYIADLEAANEALAQENSTLVTQLGEVTEAAEIKNWAKVAHLEVIPARVVAVESGRVPNQSVTIDVGRRDGLDRNLAVVGQGALVGRIVDVGPDTSTVRLISDPGSHVWSRVSESKEAMVVAGTGQGIELDFLNILAQVERGQSLVTIGSPDSRPYPAGIPIARVDSVSKDPGLSGLRVTAEPIANLTALDVVGVVLPGSDGDDR